MMNKSVVIERHTYQPKQTLGDLKVFAGRNQEYTCKTLELPWLDNQTNISCIPEGTYTVKKRRSPKYGEHFHITGVNGRSYILIHHGNYYTDIRGCVLVGREFTDINGDGLRDVTSSRKTMGILLSKLPNEFKLTIEKC